MSTEKAIKAMLTFYFGWKCVEAGIDCIKMAKLEYKRRIMDIKEPKIKVEIEFH